jgi:hypothetical protein
MISIMCTGAYSVFGAQQPQDITNKQCSSYMLQEPADRRIANPQKKNKKSQFHVTWAGDFKNTTKHKLDMKCPVLRHWVSTTKSANGCNSSKRFLTESELQWLAVMAGLHQQEGFHWWTRNKKKAWFLIAKISSTEITRPEENAYDTNPSNHRSSMFSSNPHTIAQNGHV